MRELVAKYLSKGISRRGFVSGLTKAGLTVTAAQSVIAIGGGWGTLSEIAIAKRLGRPVVTLDSWPISGLESVGTPAEAVRMALG